MKYLLKISNKTVHSNLEKECENCLSVVKWNSQIITDCPLKFRKRRNGKIEIKNKTVLLCEINDDYLKSSKLFKQKLIQYCGVLESLNSIIENAMDDVNKDTKRLLHNVISLNAHSIQELYALVPQQLLTRDLNSQIKTISDYILTNPKESAMCFLRIAKNNASMKTEFAVFKKLFETSPSLSFRKHNIRNVVLNSFHIFFQDFTDKHVYVNVEPGDMTVNIDYESFHVSLYHLIENAVKYVQPHSTIFVRFGHRQQRPLVQFEMSSIKILLEEVNDIIVEGYSGQYANKYKLNGHGIGMNRVSRILMLNHAKLIIRPNIKPEKAIEFENKKYEQNVFEILFT